MYVCMYVLIYLYENLLYMIRRHWFPLTSMQSCVRVLNMGHNEPLQTSPDPFRDLQTGACLVPRLDTTGRNS